MSVRYIRDKVRPAWGASIVPDHLRRDRRLINKHETRRIEDRLLGFQLGACGQDIRTVLLGGVEIFFEGDVVTIVKSPD
jgi:hypothetical protein